MIAFISNITRDIQILDAHFPVLTSIAVLLLGLLFGSLLNVFIIRIPKGQSVVFPGSHCVCGRPIPFYHNIPGFSWFILRGRAACCGSQFSIRYVLLEWLVGALFVLLWRFCPQSNFIPYALLVFCLIGGSFIDIEHKWIPDRFTILLAFVGVGLSCLIPSLHVNLANNYAAINESALAFIRSLCGVLAGVGISALIALSAEAVLGKEGLGFGDVKLLGAIGAILGWQGAVASLFLGALIGCLLLIIPKLRGADGDEQIPFGPSIGLAALVCIFIQPQVNDFFRPLSHMVSLAFRT